MTRQGIDINVFDGLSMSGMLSVHTATSLSAAEMNPVGRFVDRTAEESAFDECFHKERAIPVQAFPVSGQTTGGERKNIAPKSLNGNVRWDEKATIGNDELKIPFALFHRPSDPCVARRHLPGRTGKLKAGKELAGQFRRFDKIIEMSAKRDAIVKVMPSLNKLLKGTKQISVRSLDETQRKRFELTGAACDGNRRIALRNRKNNLLWARSCSIAKLWKNHQTISLKTFKERAAFFILQLAAWPFPFEEFTQGFG